MQRLEVSGAVRPIYGSLDVKRLNFLPVTDYTPYFRQPKDVWNSVTTMVKYLWCISTQLAWVYDAYDWLTWPLR